MGGSASTISYDSTWEEEDEDDSSAATERSSVCSKEVLYPKAQETPRNRKERKPKQYQYMFSDAARNMQDYRHGFQPLGSTYQSSPDEMPNLMFYKNQMQFRPNGLYIEDLLRNWKDRYDILEENHDYIQWLFPLRQPGRNPHATPLHEDEIEMMKNDEEVKRRLCEAYKLMLGFYGLQLLDESSGRVGLAQNCQERFRNLNSNTHNNLRITRILKCLGEMGFERFQAPLVRFFLKETLCNGNLPNVKISALDYFMFTVKDKKQRRNLVHFAWVRYKPQNRFRWGPVEKLRQFNPPLENEEQDDEVDISEELKTPMIPSKKDSSEGYYAKDKEIARREPKNKREYGLVRRTVDYVFMFCFRLLFSPFLVFGRLFGRFSSFFRGGISWFRRMAGNEDRSNEEQISVKTEGTRTEKTKSERLLTDPETQKRQEAEFKALNVSADVKTDNSIDESEMEAKLKTEGNGSKCESIPKDGMGSGDRKSLVNIEMPKNKQAKEDDNNTENKGDSRNVMKLNEGQTSENDRLEGAEKCSVKEDNAGNGKVSGGDREHGGTQIANAGNQKGETKIYNWNSKDEDASRVKLVPLFSGGGDDTQGAKIIQIEDHTETSTVWLGDNDGGIIRTQKTLSQKDKTDQVERDYTKNKDEEAANANLSPQFGEVGDEDENPGISKIDDSRGTLVLGSGDNDGGNIGAQNTMLETNKTEQVDRDDGKTKDEEAANVKLKPQFGEEKNPGTHKIEDNRETLVLG
ncbi:opioid growth factor receptor-like [Rana temporaria]|uniref:opioid growth factor receptor-like n=1 Tax=Rana temporaria TaxID=8407 RepID=UPI001AAD54D8|nr:opioid growth factor receptor-like [Rana temporaria]